MKFPSFYNYAISLTISFGSMTYGYAVAILGNTLTKPAWYEYMDLPLEGPRANHTTTIIAVLNTIIYAGGIVGILTFSNFNDSLGRRRAIGIGAIISIIGAALQAGSVNPAMMIASRIIVGFGMGVLLGNVPLYQAEISPPSNRGLIVGLHSTNIGLGSVFASWFGEAFFYVQSTAGWRAPLALQAVFPLVLLIGVFIVPESPRWLYMHDRADEAQAVLIKLHKRNDDPDHVFAKKEMLIIKQQIDYERVTKKPLMEALKQPSMRKRFAVGFLALWNTQVSGIIVIIAFQSSIYEALGFSNFISGVLGAVFTMVISIGCFFGGLLGDYIGRKRQIVTGLFMLTGSLICLCITTKLYAGSMNLAGQRAAVFFTFLSVAIYASGVEVASLVYSSELFPGEWRATGVATSLSAVLFGGLIFTAAAPSALKNIGAYYYVVFICLTFIQAWIVLFYFPNTKGFTLEQMSAVFGDAVVDEHGRVEKASDFIQEHKRTDVDDIVLQTTREGREETITPEKV